MRVYTLSDMRSEKKLRVYTASEAKGLTRSLSITLSQLGHSLIGLTLSQLRILTGLNRENFG